MNYFHHLKCQHPLILGIIILYMILIIPVLYFILKRKDKREYTWWIIPAIAVSHVYCHFCIRCKRSDCPCANSAYSYVECGQDGSLTGYYAESLLTNKSGELYIYNTLETTLFASNAWMMIYSVFIRDTCP